MMKLYMHPAATMSRCISHFAAETGIELEEIEINLLGGEHRQPAYLTLNPNGLVPMLDDDGFRLTEGSAILKYLADKVGSPAYPTDLRERARVNERMDWLTANLLRDLGYNLVYPQLFPHHKRRSDEATEAAVEWGHQKCGSWLAVLDQHIIGPNSDYLCLGRLTLADYLGSSVVTLGEWVRLDLGAYPNVERWLRGMKALPKWNHVNATFYEIIRAA